MVLPSPRLAMSHGDSLLSISQPHRFFRYQIYSIMKVLWKSISPSLWSKLAKQTLTPTASKTLKGGEEIIIQDVVDG